MTTVSHSELVEGALGLAARGIPVLSLRPRSKVPLHAGWPGLGMLSQDTIRLEWQLNPDAQCWCAVRTGRARRPRPDRR